MTEHVGITAFKTGLSLMTGLGIGRIVKGVADAHVEPKSKFAAVAVGVAVFGITGAASLVVDEHNNDMVDGFVDGIKAAGDIWKNGLTNLVEQEYAEVHDLHIYQDEDAD